MTQALQSTEPVVADSRGGYFKSTGAARVRNAKDAIERVLAAHGD
jgi:hypothetical protein